MPDRNTTANEQLTMHWVSAQPLVWSYIQAAVRDYQHAEDVLQQVAQQTAVSFAEYDSSRPFKAWAIGIAKNKIREHLRRQSRDKLVFSAETLEVIGDSYAEDSEYLGTIRRTLARCLAELNAQAQELLKLRYAENLKPAAIAERLATTTNSVRIRLHRYRTALAECVNTSLAQTEEGP